MKLEDYALIGDLHTAALVGRNGAIDWCCLPRFDSDACFAALVGSEENGCWQIAPAEAGARSRAAYRGDTLVLETEFETSSGTVLLTDCMAAGSKYPRLIRMVEGRRGRVPMRMKLIVRFDHGQRIPWVQRGGDGLPPDRLRIVAGPHGLVLDSDVPVRGEELSTVADFSLRAGDRRCFTLSWHPSHLPAPPPGDPQAQVASTDKFWRTWAKRCTYEGEFREAVVRSLITLKALIFEPTGGIVAAPTTSLPERIGGVRNWDYRYCWLRDSTLTLFALMEAGYRREAAAWVEWLLRTAAGDPGQLQILYGTHGERVLTELELPHLGGYENSRPVRKGNAASEQFQLDVYGEVMDALLQARRMKIRPPDDPWPLQRHLAEFVAKHWTSPDDGIWEIRGPRRHFTHSKVMAWVAIDRAVRMAESFRFKAPLEAWRRLRSEIHREVCERAYERGRGVFTQSYGSPNLDAALLMMPLVGFLPASDPRIVRTVDAIAHDLVVDGLVLRYHPDGSPAVDGLPPGEGTFLPCSFWLVDCYCLLGRMEEARDLYRRLLTLRSPVGLLAEEYDPRSRRLLGNYPQAFSHVGLVNSAHNLTQKLGPAGKRVNGHSAPVPAFVA